MAHKFPKIGLALGSGGVKGLAHIGVLKSLEKHNIPVDYLAASSIGSIIGAHYARYRDVKKMEEIILSFNRRKGMELFDFTVKGGFIKGEKTESFIREILGDAHFQDLAIPLSVVATDFNTAESLVYNKGNVSKAVRASISVPAIYQPIFYLHKLVADGGLSNPVPVSVVSEMGADITIAVNLDKVYSENPYVTIPPLSQVPLHAINILRHNLSRLSIKSADVIITPKNKLHVGFIGLYQFFDNNKVRQIIDEGEDAADSMIPQIEKYIDSYRKNNSPLKKLLIKLKLSRTHTR